MSTLVPIDSERIAVMARGGTQLRAIADVVGDYGDARDYGPSVEEGAARIQAMASGDAIGTAEPTAIYIGPGTHTLSAPITITRHNVTLIVDGGARLIPPANQAAIVIDGLQTPETNIKNWGIFMHGVIWPTSTGGSSQHGIVLRHVIHGTLFANEIRALGGSGIVFDGNNFSNKIDFNRIHGCAGWGIANANTPSDAQPYKTTNLVTGEIQSCTLGGADLYNWFDSQFYLRVENMSGGVDAVAISDSRNLKLSGYFENPLNTTGNDIKITGVTIPSEDIVLDHIAFYTEKNSDRLQHQYCCRHEQSYYVAAYPCRIHYRTRLACRGCWEYGYCEIPGMLYRCWGGHEQCRRGIQIRDSSISVFSSRECTA